MKRFILWLRITAALQLITCVLHGISLFLSPPATNDTERQLQTLTDTYRFDLGVGFHRTMSELVFVLSAGYSMLFLLGGLLNFYFAAKKPPTDLMKGVLTINGAVFGLCFALTGANAFLPPIVCSGLVFLSLIVTRAMVPRNVPDYA